MRTKTGDESHGSAKDGGSQGNYYKEEHDGAYVARDFIVGDMDNLARGRWYLDSGCTNHLTNQKVDFISFTPLSATVRVGGDNWVNVAGVGTVRKVLSTSGGLRTLLLHDTRYVPELQCSLFSVRRQVKTTLPPDQRVRIHFDDDDFAMVKLECGSTTARIDETNLYHLQLESPPDSAMMSTCPTEQSLSLWHARLGHPGQNVFNALFRHADWPLTNVDLRVDDKFHCESCVKGKLTRKSFHSVSAPGEWLVGEFAHVDVWGPYAVASYSGNRYFVLFVDEASRFATLYLMKERSDVYGKFELLYEHVKTQLKVRMKKLRCDNAKELLALGNRCKKHYGIECSLTVKHTPEQNGVAERMIRTVTERMRCLLVHFRLQGELWAEAAVTAAFYVNIVPNATKGMQVPYAVWYRETPSYSRLRTFGCAVLAYVDKVERKKMESKAREAIFVGYSREQRGYRLLDSETNKSFYSHTAVFYENKPGRVLISRNQDMSTVPTTQYLGVNTNAMESIPSLLEEADCDRADGANAASQTGGAGNQPGNARAGGADGQDDSARTGGAEAHSGSEEATQDGMKGEKRGRPSDISEDAQPHQKKRRKQNQSAPSTVVARGAEDHNEHLQVDYLRGKLNTNGDMPARGAKKKRRSGRRKAPAVEVQLRQSCDDKRSSDELPARERPSIPTVRGIMTTDSEMPSARDASSKEGLTASTKRGLREYVASEGACTEVCPVTRSGRVSKPPSWFGDYIHVAYSNTNPEEDAVCSGSVEWAKAREELQRAMAKEKALDWFQDYCCLAVSIITEPDTLDEAFGGEQAMQWKRAADDEYCALMENGTWVLVPRQKRMNVLRNRWIFRVKYMSSGEIERFKARLVIKGFMQTYGVDYLEVYSPVVRLETLRILLTLAAVWDYEAHQMDVTTAFLNGDIDVEVFMEQPEGYVVKGKEDWVCLLRKSLYGLKQAPRVWFRLLKSYLEDQGFGFLSSEPCVAVKVIDGWLVFIPIYVDDLILFAPNMVIIQMLKDMLSARFKMKDLGELHYILGWEITRNRQERTVFVSQRKYAMTVLERFQMSKCNGCKTPGTADLKLSKVMCPTDADEKALMKTKPYRAVIGSLMYLMLGTRPDFAYLVRECSQFLENPGVLHWRAAKRGLRYLKETLDWGLRLGGIEWVNGRLDNHLEAFADADFANRTDDRKSVAGYLTKFCGSTISWSSQTEKTVALHTTEAEYMALSLLVQEVVHLRQMLKELKVQQRYPSEVYVDNESAKKLAKNPQFHNRTKHIDVRHHFVRERIELKQIDVERVAGADNVADAFTKPLARPAFEKHRTEMGLLPLSEFEKRPHNHVDQ